MVLRKFFVIGLAGLFFAVGLSARAGAAGGAADSPSAVVMISLDGLAGYYLDDAKADMPTLRELAAKGARAESMKVVAPSVTWPNHTTLVTGDTPARHGVVGNNYFDRKSERVVTLIGDPMLDKQQVVRVPTIYDVAHEAKMSTASVRWPETRGADTLDWTVPTCKAPELFKRYTTPSLRAECESAGIWKGEPPGDEACTRIFDFILHEHHPRLGLLHLSNIDHQEHENGPRSARAYKAVHEADQQVRQVWEQLERDFPGEATLIVVSDHGFSPIHGAVLPNVVLRDAGLIQVKGKEIVGGDVRIVPQGGAALVYILNSSEREKVAARVEKAFAGVKGIEKVVPTEQLNEYGVGTPEQDPHAPDMLLSADEGYVFGDTAAGALSFQEKPERRGSHGHDPNLPDLHATFIAWGKGIKAGSRVGIIDNTSVAPTIARLLGVQLPDVQGKVLTEILSEK